MSADVVPTLECDIVMKGGITSGVVYPRAVVELAKAYRFRSIGGTSAGAIAAAVVAAAEHGRREGAPGGGFDVLAALPGELAQTGPDGKAFMLQLFQPDPATRGLFDVAIGAMGPDRGRDVAAALRQAFPPSRGARVAGGAVGGAARVFGRLRPRSKLAPLIAELAPVAGALRHPGLRGAVTALGANDFGLCRLGPDAGTAARPALTAWLHARIQQAAGRGADGAVLTFADLWGAPPLADPGDAEAVRARRDGLRRLCVATEDRAVDLQMMTTDLTHGRPLRLPVAYQPHKDRLEEGGGTLLYDPAELAHFFPAGVMEHLARAAACDPFREDTAAGLAATGCGHLRRFPIGPDLPVIVGTRMSLSFPLLIAAIPLYEITRNREAGAADAGRVTGARRVYFSDGGISSNFPVHFFDGPLPKRPTFGLQLTSFGPGEEPTTDAHACVVAPPPPGTPAPPTDARAIEDLPGFLAAIKDAMQNWRDNAQSQLPGFRDRIVQIRLGPKEGGLNLNMTAEQITGLTDRGAVAGQELVALFATPDDGAAAGAPPRATQWDSHRFVRFRTTMSLLERFLDGYADAYGARVPLALDYPARVAEGEAAKPYAFESRTRTDAATATAQRYCDLAHPTDAASLDDRRVPRPPSILRAVPPA
jgi:predicted acylesterase/phospholipase RssA